MVRLHRVIAALALIASGAAQAADMPGIPLPPSIPVTPVAPIAWLNYGWYLRGDLGYQFSTISRAEASPPFVSPRDSKLSNSFVGSLGAGIKTSWLRTDFTLDYISPEKYTGTSPGTTTARIQGNTALFNGYFDLGTWYRLTPYIGAGAGVGYVRVTDYQSTIAPPFAPNSDSNQWKFAWAAMAGVGWQISPNMLLDVGYRYLNLGDVHTGTDAFGTTTFKNVGGHQVRVGVRWSFDDVREYR